MVLKKSSYEYSTLQVDILKPEQFNVMRDEWNHLLGLSETSNVFMTWEWLYLWWKEYGDKKSKLMIISVREEGRLIGIAPLYVRFNGFIKVIKEVRFIGSNIVCPDHLEFIMLKGRGKEIASAIINFLSQHVELWDILNLTSLPSESEIIKTFPHYIKKRYQIKDPYTVCPYIDLTVKWEEILASFSSRIRNIIKRRGKKFHSLKDSFFEEADLNEDFEKKFSEFLQLSKLRFQVKNMVPPFNDLKFLEFHKSVLMELYQKGKAKIFFLKVEGRAIAGIYLLYYNNTVYYYQAGFDPLWDNISPGTLLFYYVIKNEHERGMKVFDFLRGDESYKNLWTNQKKTNVSLTAARSYYISVCNCFFDAINRLLSVLTLYYKRFRLNFTSK